MSPSFAETKIFLGLALGKHFIETKPGTQPIKSKRRRVSPQQEEEINKQADQMMKDGIARPSSSPWASNFILVKSKDGSLCFVVDYRQLNDVTIKDAYPMPNVRGIIDKMKGAQFFSKMDMASAYWAVPIREQDREKTAFYTPQRLLEMCLTAYGLCNSQQTYQRIMDEALLNLKKVDSFFDDVCQYSPILME